MAEIYEYPMKVQIPEGATNKLRQRVELFARECEFGARLFAIKNHQYGDTIKYVGLRGISYEILGASARLHHLVNKVDQSYNISPQEWNEMVGDVLVDILNFAVIGGMLLGEGNINGEY